MNKNYKNIICSVYSILVKENLIQQIDKIIKKNVKNIFYLSIGINILSCVFMLIYGIGKILYPVIIFNILLFISSIIILFVKRYYHKKIQTNKINHIKITNDIKNNNDDYIDDDYDII